MKNETKFEMYNSAMAPIISRLCRIAKIKETVDNMVTWRKGNSKITPGILIETLVISIICGRKPLWKVEEFWKKQDLDYFFSDSNLTAEQLNDDAYGRALDKLSEIKMETLVSLISLTMLKEHNESIEIAHFDTTSKSVQGLYEGKSSGDFDINHGYSKDHRPDLKQFKIGTAVQQNGLPIMGELLSGNKSDREWNPEAVIKMNEYFESNDYSNITYIGDSATVSSYKSLEKLKGIKYISRFPESFSLVKKLKEKAIQESKWEKVENTNEEKKKKDSEYKICSYNEEIKGEEYRFVVVHSKALKKKKEKTLKKKKERLKEKLYKKAKNLSKKAFACIEDAQRAKEELAKEIKLNDFDFKFEIIEKVETVHKKKGRPKKGTEGEKTTNYFIENLSLSYNIEEYKKQIEIEGCFVLITSIKDREENPDEKILKEYKNQISVEETFKFLKSPVYLGPVYLKNKKRVEALGYVFILVLIIASYLKYRVRKALKESNESLELPGSQRTNKPSVKTILEILETVLILVINGKRYFQKNIDDRVYEIIKWSGFDSNIYLEKLDW